ncbi:hypothetical protein MLD38_035854 [Melastoma candidum]|uniref:Uncharacterized protein n=1 Tax=Melastoma candidum TaxID=119954 RepID=A0ACB9LJP5_9MYRT|nr:hypothetical protein MLD38_035854 [Melastoma candidum]
MSHGIFSMEQYGYNYSMMEKRRLFLRSYQFSRKRSLAERVRGSLASAKRVVWSRLRKLVWAKLSRLRRNGFNYRRRSGFLHHLQYNYNRIILGQADSSNKSSPSSW